MNNLVPIYEITERILFLRGQKVILDAEIEKEEVVANCDHLKKLRFYKGLPYVFTEHGAVMAASILHSEQAVKVSIYVVRVFVKMRELISHHKELFEKMTELEKVVLKHDSHIRTLFEAIRELMKPQMKPRRQIGF